MGNIGRSSGPKPRPFWRLPCTAREAMRVSGAYSITCAELDGHQDKPSKLVGPSVIREGNLTCVDLLAVLQVSLIRSAQLFIDEKAWTRWNPPQSHDISSRAEPRRRAARLREAFCSGMAAWSVAKSPNPMGLAMQSCSPCLSCPRPVSHWLRSWLQDAERSRTGSDQDTLLDKVDAQPRICPGTPPVATRGGPLLGNLLGVLFVHRKQRFVSN